MTEKNSPFAHPFDITELSRIMTEVNEKSQKLVEKFMAQKNQPSKIDQTEAQVISNSFQELTSKLMSNPTQLFNPQMTYWQEYWGLIQKNATQLLGQRTVTEPKDSKSDKRFQDEAWDSNPMFSFIKQSYLLTARYIRNAIHNIHDLDDKTRQRVEFYTNQYLDAISPSNFVMTNPELIKLTIESRGENLLKGLDNLLDDLDRGPCQLQIKMTDLDAFIVGKNLAMTPGKIIFQNDLMQLIQYEPATETVFKNPLMIIPPWINKYYILDLTEKNSMVKWMVEQGYTVFMISWANPDETLIYKDFQDYMLEGPITALDTIERVTGQRKVNAIGYCMGGTLLACTAAYLHGKGEGDRIASNTYMASLLDFSNPGDMGVFIDEEQILALEKQMDEKGYLDGCAMSNSFSMLRANDLVWSFVVNNYLKGTSPVPFDVLFWNSDSTNLPAKMHSYYLRNMYLDNRLRKPGGISLNNVPIDLSKITNPVYFISTREDHIAIWQSTYKGTKLHTGPVRFVLGASGHVAGIVNPPFKIKYGHWTNEDLPETAEEWLNRTEFHETSWWLDWAKWNKAYAGEMVAARKLTGNKFKNLEDAPGCYVTKRLDRPESGVCYLPNALL